ncbi:beta/gamma crystallin family protein [Ideonella oryzae]|uniref:Beta/gamma crystallin family protein n=1 Tax=Ideonella oryzae TaxID=2937441 RepID=A0ABT1BP68_9BURK|nr:beta/gamma crystallin family protein [Ideonella oryzae]MCO5978018.1 beta/gamma crystallin family protein [Ideonella oryzae]
MFKPWMGAVAVLLATSAAHADVTLYQDDNFQGRSFASSGEIADLKRLQFNDRASSVIVHGERWTLCSDAEFRGQCVSLAPGRYPTLRAMGLNDRLSSLRPEGGGWGGGWGQDGQGTVVLYENDDFNGRSLDASQGVDDLQPRGFNDRVSSIVIRRGLWEFCSDADYRGQCITLGPGRYPNLRTWSLNDKLSSVRRVNGGGTGATGGQWSAIQLYEHADFGGRSLDASRGVDDLGRTDLNDRISSVVIRWGRWELCSDAYFRGRCITLGPGQYADLQRWDFNDTLSSVRPAGWSPSND